MFKFFYVFLCEKHLTKVKIKKNSYFPEIRGMAFTKF